MLLTYLIACILEEITALLKIKGLGVQKSVAKGGQRQCIYVHMSHDYISFVSLKAP